MKIELTEKMNLICPLTGIHRMPCIGELCSWWDDYEGQCAVQEIVRELANIIGLMCK